MQCTTVAVVAIAVLAMAETSEGAALQISLE